MGVAYGESVPASTVRYRPKLAGLVWQYLAEKPVVNRVVPGRKWLRLGPGLFLDPDNRL